MTPERLAKIKALTEQDITHAMHGGCTDYYCDCHLALPELLAEVARLRGVISTAYEALVQGDLHGAGFILVPPEGSA